jgi:thiol-disulfide isomerase/thioredoxin
VKRVLCAIAGLALAVTTTACSSPKGADPSTPAEPSAPAPAFSYQALDGRTVSSRSLLGRVSVIGFVTSYDVHCQAEARYLALLEKHHAPRVNVVALALEAPENQPMVEAFVASLGLTFPVAMADAPTIAGEGPFKGLHHVPGFVILDRTGREAWRHAGFLNEAALEQAVRAVESSSPPAPEIDGGL